MSMIGKTIAHYHITEMIGKGGMGVVYKARDTHLDRSVAIKVLPTEAVADTERKRRFVQEAKAASALNHPNIITIHDISQADGVDFIAMEHVEGRTLNRFISAAKLNLEQALDIAIQIASALAAAHAAGIVHRDLKPSNIMITEKGLVKVLDFGLAKLTERIHSSVSSTAETMTPITDQGAVVGTAAYMSPEQAEGNPVDARSDVFSFGAVFYELLSGRRAFQGESYVSTLSAILRDTPTPIRKLRVDVPAEMERTVSRCLEKNREARYASAAEVWRDLNAVQLKLTARQAGFKMIIRKPQFAIPMMIVLAALAVAIGWFWVRSSRINWARTVALPEAARLIDAQRNCAALQLIRQVEPYLKNDSELESLRKTATVRATITTDPPGADVYIRDYADPTDSSEWMYIGRTPLQAAAIPNNYFAYKLTKADFEDREGATALNLFPVFQIALSKKGTNPPGMIWMPSRPAGNLTVIMTEPIKDLGLEGYWLDRYEVTNKQFKEFVDRGAYEKKEYWKYPFMKGGRIISWEDAISSFRDATGRPGPATWEYGSYPQDQADYPVSGVSWYEAAAYAEFAGKSLPTVHHWASAAGGIDSSIMQVSNFSGKGPARVGRFHGLSPYGNYDMAGNVKEWCLNPSGTDRYILGGAWNEPSYTFSIAGVRSPMDRSAVNGFRCAKYPNPPSEKLTGSVKLFIRDRRRDKPVSDSIFKVYRSIHQYDHGDLRATIESSNDSFPFWRLEKVSFQAAYGGERVPCYLYLPKNATPPYQTVVYFPPANAIFTQSSQSLDTSLFAFIIRSGRAVIQPIYKGTYERASGLTFMTFHIAGNLWREIAIENAKDLGRSLDYLETRSDIDRGKLAIYGFSMGASEGVRCMALEPRLKVGVLLHGGAYQHDWPQEVDPFNFAPRVFGPILMLNGKDDIIVPLEGSQIPFFQALGTPEQDKKHFVVDGGHGIITHEIIREALAWFDRYLGPVRTR
jgi:tRNA A-37 threonylcarbamoyl transferase component Bud32/predicted esterase